MLCAWLKTSWYAQLRAGKLAPLPDASRWTQNFLRDWKALPEARAVQQSCVFQHGKSSGISHYQLLPSVGSAQPVITAILESTVQPLQISQTLPGKAVSRDLQRKPQGSSQSPGHSFWRDFQAGDPFALATNSRTTYPFLPQLKSMSKRTTSSLATRKYGINKYKLVDKCIK